MPKFKLNKLVRDKLHDEYERVGQKAVYRQLLQSELKQELLNKVVEEAREIQIDSSTNEITDEIADIRQVIDDLMSLYGITEGQILDAKQMKFRKKGGFINGRFVETLELSDGDKWVEYYRKQPDIFPEV